MWEFLGVCGSYGSSRHMSWVLVMDINFLITVSYVIDNRELFIVEIGNRVIVIVFSITITITITLIVCNCNSVRFFKCVIVIV
jgi:hypothetical protein